MGNKRYKFSRYAMYNSIQSFFNINKCVAGRCLLIGDTLKGLGANTAITDMLPAGCSILIPDYPEVDIQDMPYEDNMFDYVISDQVLEHVMRPWVAVNEIYRVLKPGGLNVLTTCLMNYVHGVPDDYFRFTPDGLRSLCGDFSRIEVCDGHGNLDFIVKVLTGKRKKPVVVGSSLAKEACISDNKNLYLVWIIAQK